MTSQELITQEVQKLIETVKKSLWGIGWYRVVYGIG